MKKRNILKIFFISQALLSGTMLSATASNKEKIFSSESKELFNIKFLRPEKEENPKLKKEVNLSFYETRVSEILTTISKIGEFNLIFPKNIDRKISINLHKSTIEEAIEDIVITAKLKSFFENNTLRVYENDLKKVEFYSFSPHHSSPASIAEILNEELFKQITISQSKDLPKPYSFVNPSNNELTIVANQEQIEIAKDFIESIDKQQDVKVLKLRYISSLKAQKLIQENFPNLRTELAVKQIKITGNGASILQAKSFIEKVDIPSKNTELIVSMFYLKNKLKDREELLIKEFLQPASLMNIPESIYSSDRFQSLQKLLIPFHQTEVTLKSDKTSENIKGSNFYFENIGNNQIGIKLRNQSKKLGTDELLAYLDKSSKLLSKGTKGKNSYSYVLVLMKLN